MSHFLTVLKQTYLKKKIKNLCLILCLSRDIDLYLEGENL